MDELAQLKDQAKIIATSSLVPKQYQGSPHDCFIAIQAAKTLGCDPMLFMQQTYVLHGKPAMSAKFQIALANQSQRIRGGLRWRVLDGDYICYATCAMTGELLEGPIVNIQLAKAEGWTKNSKYQTMPDLMLRYRAASFFISLYMPEATMGFASVEEIQDIHASDTGPAALPKELQEPEPEPPKAKPKAKAKAKPKEEPVEAEVEKVPPPRKVEGKPLDHMFMDDPESAAPRDDDPRQGELI